MQLHSRRYGNKNKFYHFEDPSQGSFAVSCTGLLGFGRLRLLVTLRRGEHSSDVQNPMPAWQCRSSHRLQPKRMERKVAASFTFCTTVPLECANMMTSAAVVNDGGSLNDGLNLLPSFGPLFVFIAFELFNN